MWSFDSAHSLMQIVSFIIISFVLCTECAETPDGTPAIAQVSLIPDIDNFQRQRGGHRIIAATIPTPCGINMNLHLWGETNDIIELCRKFGIGPQPLQYPQPYYYGPDQYSYPPNHPYHSQQPQYEQYPQPLRSVHGQYSYNPDHPQQPQQQQQPQQSQYEQAISQLQQGLSSPEMAQHIPPETAERENADQEAFKSIYDQIARCLGNVDTASDRAKEGIERIKQQMTEISESIPPILDSSQLSEGARGKLLGVRTSLEGGLQRLSDASEWKQITETLERDKNEMDQLEQPDHAHDNQQLAFVSQRIGECIRDLASMATILAPVQQGVREIIETIQSMLRTEPSPSTAAKLRAWEHLIQETLARHLILDHPQNVIGELKAAKAELMPVYLEISIDRCLEVLYVAPQERDASAITEKIAESEGILRGILREIRSNLVEHISI